MWQLSLIQKVNIRILKITLELLKTKVDTILLFKLKITIVDCVTRSRRMNQTEKPMNLEQPKLTIEQEQEQKLRSKYPNPQKPGGSAFIHKMLHKGVRSCFKTFKFY